MLFLLVSLLCVVQSVHAHCSPPKKIANGQVSYLPIRPMYSTATYTCNSGYVITSGDAIRVCMHYDYNGTEATCSDMDECALDVHECDTNAVCTNTVGSYTCACNTGYSGDGVTCSEICGAKCPDGWVWFQESCYLFWNNTSISFANAVEICQQNGAHPVFVETAEENSFLKNYLRQMEAAFWWIGLTDQETEGTWKWYGTNNVVTFTDWHIGEPNGGRNENCVHFFSWYDYTWNDIGCTAETSYTLYAICEKQSC